MNDSVVVSVASFLEVAFICSLIAAVLVVRNELRKRRRARERAQAADETLTSLEVLKAMAAKAPPAAKDQDDTR